MKDKNNYYNDETFEAIYQKMREKFAPTPVTYTPVDEQTLAERISKVLRPMYDKAIAALFKGNQRSDAELDADAISRGMGSSTYVTDVKRRQDNATAEGARDLESDYGAKMADQLYKAMEGEREKQLEVEKFNAQQKSAADAQAFEAAKVMYEAYLAAKKRHGGGGAPRQPQRPGLLRHCESGDGAPDHVQRPAPVRAHAQSDERPPSGQRASEVPQHVQAVRSPARGRERALRRPFFGMQPIFSDR